MRKAPMSFHPVLAGLLGMLVFSAATFSQLPTSNRHWFWQNPKPHGDAILAASFVSPSEGWAAGQTQGVLHTTGGGASWTANRFGPPLGFNNLSFRDSMKGCAVGQSSNSGGWGSDSVIWTTSDGGVTWNADRLSALPEQMPRAIVVQEDRHGLAIGEYGLLFATADEALSSLNSAEPKVWRWDKRDSASEILRYRNGLWRQDRKE